MEAYTLLSLGLFIGLATSYAISVLATRGHKRVVDGFRVVSEKSSVTEKGTGECRPKVFIPRTLARWPWPRRISQHYPVVKESADWAASFRAFSPNAQQAFDRGAFGHLACMAYPNAKKVFVIDEYTDVSNPFEVQKQKDIIMDAFRNPHKPRPEGEWVGGEMTRQFWELTIRNASEQSQRRFIAGFDEYLEAVVQQAIDRSGSHIRDIQSYIDIRRDTIGAKPAFALIELGLEIPDEVMSHPAIQEMVVAAIDMICISNDITSYNIEQSCGNDSHNVVTIVMKELGTNVNGAMLWAQDCHTELEQKFHAAMAALPELDEPLNSQVKEYCNGLAQWVRANDDWEFEGGRYFGDKGREIREKRWMFLLPKERKNGAQEVGPILVDGSLL
ncbi:terpenoid synthase [Boletus edulis]|nr:terpenoid synthase [Boletus edulis]